MPPTLSRSNASRDPLGWDGPASPYSAQSASGPSEDEYSLRSAPYLGVIVPTNDPFDDLDIPDDPTADLDRATQRLTVRTEQRRYGKHVVVIEGFAGDTDRKALASELKSALGTGGTAKESRIEIQGDHEPRIRDLLEEKGFQLT